MHSRAFQPCVILLLVLELKNGEHLDRNQANVCRPQFMEPRIARKAHRPRNRHIHIRCSPVQQKGVEQVTFQGACISNSCKCVWKLTDLTFSKPKLAHWFNSNRSACSTLIMTKENRLIPLTFEKSSSKCNYFLRLSKEDFFNTSLKGSQGESQVASVITIHIVQTPWGIIM